MFKKYLQKINEESISKLIKALSKLSQQSQRSQNQGMPPILKKLSDDALIVPYGDNNYVIIEDSTGELLPYQFNIDPKSGEIYSEIKINGKKYKVIIKGKDEKNNYIVEIKNENDQNFNNTKNKSKKSYSEIVNVTDKLEILDKCKFINNIKKFNDFLLKYNKENNIIIYKDNTQEIVLTSRENNTYQSKEKCIIISMQGYLWYDTDECEKIYFIVNFEDIYCYDNIRWSKISKYPQKLIDLFSKRNNINNDLREKGKLYNLHQQRRLQSLSKQSQQDVSSDNQKIFIKTLLKLLQQKQNIKNLSIIKKNKSTVLSPKFRQSLLKLSNNLPNLSNIKIEYPINILAQLSRDLFIIPYGETSIVIAKNSDNLYQFQLLFDRKTGKFYCKIGKKFTLYITAENGNNIIELKNEKGQNVIINKTKKIENSFSNISQPLNKNTPVQSILEILKQFNYNIREMNDNILSIYHGNSVILSIKYDTLTRLYLLPMNRLEILEFNYIGFEYNYYKFKNKIADMEISIYTTSGGIFFKQNKTKIIEHFTSKTISDLLNIQIFYFKFSDIYELLANKFKKNEKWNNNLEIKQEEYNGAQNEYNGEFYCAYIFKDSINIRRLLLISRYDIIKKEYNHNINGCELIKDEKNNNKYITKKVCQDKYEIDLTTNKIIKIDTSNNNSGIFELKWSEEKLYHWDKIKNAEELPEKFEVKRRLLKTNVNNTWNHNKANAADEASATFTFTDEARAKVAANAKAANEARATLTFTDEARAKLAANAKAAAAEARATFTFTDEAIAKVAANAKAANEARATLTFTDEARAKVVANAKVAAEARAKVVANAKATAENAKIKRFALTSAAAFDLEADKAKADTKAKAAAEANEALIKKCFENDNKIIVGKNNDIIIFKIEKNYFLGTTVFTYPKYNQYKLDKVGSNLNVTINGNYFSYDLKKCDREYNPFDEKFYAKNREIENEIEVLKKAEAKVFENKAKTALKLAENEAAANLKAKIEKKIINNFEQKIQKINIINDQKELKALETSINSNWRIINEEIPIRDRNLWIKMIEAKSKIDSKIRKSSQLPPAQLNENNKPKKSKSFFGRVKNFFT